VKRRAGAAASLALLTLAAAPPAAPPSASLRFEDGTRASGIDFHHAPNRSPLRLMPEVLGSGVVLADFNRDGAVDVLLVNSGQLGAVARPAGAENRLYINDGKGHFRDATVEWGLPSPGYGMGAAAGDFDNDGWTDLFLTTFDGPDTLLRNDHGRFVDVTRQAGIVQDGRWSTSAGFFDLDGDGDLDLWVVRYVRYSPRDALPCYHNGARVYCTPLVFEGLPSRLLRNNGNGTFTDVSSTLRAPLGKGLALLIGDIDQDGDADVFVANDSTANHLWLNEGAGRLREAAMMAGVALSEMGSEQAGMGADMSDVDGDGRLDLAVTNFQGETTSIYLQGERGVFQEVSDAVGVGEAARARLKFGIDFFDADNDGDEDLLVANGHIEDNVGAFTRNVSFEQPNTLYEHLEGSLFRDVSALAGPALQDRQVSRGLATGDLNGDGLLDFVVTNNGGTAQVGINACPRPGRFVSLWLEGRKANRSAIGARVVARVGARTLVRQVHGASSYMSMCDPRIHLGLGSAAAVDELTIHWPGSSPQVLRGLPAGRHYHVVEGQPPVAYEPGAAVIPPSR
jgi:enediyne biosynthesis protein E4